MIEEAKIRLAPRYSPKQQRCNPVGRDPVPMKVRGGAFLVIQPMIHLSWLVRDVGSGKPVKAPSFKKFARCALHLQFEQWKEKAELAGRFEKCLLRLVG